MKAKKTDNSAFDVPIGNIPPYADIIDKYSIKAQAAIYVILEEVNIGMNSTLPITEWPPYDYDIQMLVDSVVSKQYDHEFETSVTTVAMDFRDTMENLPKLVEGIKKGKYKLENNEDRLMNYGTMVHVVYELLLIMSKKTPQEVQALLTDIQIHQGQPTFPSMEAIAVEIIQKITEHLLEFCKEK